MTAEGIKQLKVVVTTIATILGGGIGVYEGYIHIAAGMNETAKKKIENYTKPVVKEMIQATLDSITENRSVSFTEALSKKLNVDKSAVVEVISKWYKKEQRFSPVGLMLDLEVNKIVYIHTDGTKYRPFYSAEQSQYYFINSEDQVEWCK